MNLYHFTIIAVEEQTCIFIIFTWAEMSVSLQLQGSTKEVDINHIFISKVLERWNLVYGSTRFIKIVTYNPHKNFVKHILDKNKYEWTDSL